MTAAPTLVDRLAGHPAIYNLIQDVAGRRVIARRMQPWLDQVSGRVLDVGGGTGQVANQLVGRVRYLCLDLDPIKLRRLKKDAAGADALVADAAALPLRSAAVDTALCFGVSHHLSGDAWPAVVAEIARVLVPGGRLIFLDALWAPRRRLGRLLWAWDRGSHPRTAAALERDLRASFDIEHASTFAVLHEYCVFACRKPVGRV